MIKRSQRIKIGQISPLYRKTKIKRIADPLHFDNLTEESFHSPEMDLRAKEDCSGPEGTHEGTSSKELLLGQGEPER